MTIAYHIYTLVSAVPIGTSRGAARQGALLRIAFPGGEIGHADIHPWPELGDAPLSVQIESLRRGETTHLTRAALAFAKIDAQARAAGLSLWDGRTMAPSHFLVPDVSNGREVINKARAEGFTHFKIKIGRDLTREKRALLTLCADFADNPAPCLRLDMNETLTAAAFADWFAGLDALLPFCDFMEDPVPYDKQLWAELGARFGVRFAIDRAAESDAGASEPILVHKPARFGPGLPTNHGRERIIITSALDHPFGQMCAAWVAAQLPCGASPETHGLASHRVYAPNAFSEQLGWHGPRLSLPGGPGFGWDEELKALNWTPLT